MCGLTGGGVAEKPNRGGMLEVLGDAEGGTTRGVDVPRGAGDAAASVGVSENVKRLGLDGSAPSAMAPSSAPR